MGPIDALQSVLQNYAEFSGRATRSEYWWFVAIWTLAYIIVLVIQRNKTKLPEIGFYVVTIVPAMSVSFRRLQDAGHSGWWSLLELAILGALFAALIVSLPAQDGATSQQAASFGPLAATSTVLFLLATLGICWHFALPSQPGPNQYGPNPHEVTS